MAAAEQPAGAGSPFPWPFFTRYVYAAKFLCGEMKPKPGQEGPVQPGSYSTAINVHNPHGYTVGIRKKAVLLYDGRKPEEAIEEPMPPTHPRCPQSKQLLPDWGLEIDCRDIREVLLAAAPDQPGPPAPVFIKGWVVIETSLTAAIDVVAVYTVAPIGAKGQGPVSITTERITGNVVYLPGF